MYMYTCIIMRDNVRFFKALGDETRLIIIGFLLENETCACDFASMTKKDQTTISRHLKILVDAGILDYDKKGRNKVYRFKDKNVKKLLLSLGIKPGGSEYCRREAD
jgi:DNA-binding transcriptional ArsR family regulator